jgi:hypothetical protein
MYSLALIIFVASEKKAFEHFLTLDPMGKMFQNASSLKPPGQMKPNCPGMIIGRFSTNFMALIIFVVSEKKAFEHFPIGSNVNLCIAVVAILDFRST